MRVIGHLDADSYCSAERVRFPWMRYKPVGVVGNQGACVIAVSREMKAKGVRVGEAIWEAAKLCPRGVYVKRDFQWYEVLSKMMWEIIKSFSNEVEYYAVDEFFFGLDVKDEAEAQQLARELQSSILQQTQLPVTVGIARTKTLAKLLSDQSKPFGMATMLTRPDEEAFLSHLPGRVPSP
jgi:DNA polymerase V